MRGFIFFIIIVLSVYGGTNFYIARRSFQWLNAVLPGLSGKIFAIIYICIALSMFLGFSPLPPGIKRIAGWISSHWMGVYVYLLFFILLADIIILAGSLLKIIPSPIPHNIRFYTGIIVIALTIGFIGYGKFNASRISLVSYDVQTEKTSLERDLKIALISDLHLGSVNSEKNLERVVYGVNKLEADIVCLAGDIFNDDINSIRNPAGTTDLLKSINSTYGVYACLGNHDAGKTFNEMLRFLEESNVKLLKDEYVIIDEKLALFGRLDPSPIGGFAGLERKDVTDMIKSIDPGLPILVMDHNPANIGEYGGEVDLILSGHTHKGQIFPANLITKAIYTVDYGYYRKDSGSPQVIVTSGAGTWAMPMRIGTNNEIVSITLRKK